MVKIGIKRWIIFSLIMLLLTDLVIIFNIPLLRPIFAFVYFTLIPGIFILRILKLNKLNFLKKFVLSTGLSITFMIFAGLTLNSFYPFVMKPLSLYPLLVVFNALLFILMVFDYKINKFETLNFQIDLSKFKISFFIPILLPFLAVLGTYLMNTEGNNIILLYLLFLIPIYIVLITYENDSNIYPLAIWMIAMSLLLMHGLTSNHLMGLDVYNEFYSFKLTLSNFHWDVSNYYSASNACLSVTILPTIYYTLSQLSQEYIFKLFFGLIGSIIPLCVYLVCEKYMESKYSFLATLFFIFQTAFIYNLLSSTKTLIAILFFALSILVLFSDEIQGMPKKSLFILFMISIVVSHYTTSYIYLLILIAMAFPFFLKKLVNVTKIQFLKNKKLKSGSYGFISSGIIFLCFALIFLWYAQLTTSPLTNTVSFVSNTISNMGNFFVSDVRSPTQLAVVGIGVTKVPSMISTIVFDFIFATIGLGIITLIWKYNYRRNKLSDEFMAGMIISTILLFSFLVIPYLSKGYGGTRLFEQLAIFLAPAFIFGCIKLANLVKKPQLDILIILVLLISAFSCVTYLQYHFYGTPVSPDYETGGLTRGQMFVYDQDIVTSQWLHNYQKSGYEIYTDYCGSLSLALAFNSDPHKTGETSFFSKNQTIKNGYIYLRYTNVVKGKVYSSSFLDVQNLNEYNNLFINKNKIYDNGGGNIWF